MTFEILQAAVGAAGLVAVAMSIWYLDENYDDLEKKLTVKIAAATVIFSIMMFTPLIDTHGRFLQLGPVYFPSLKIVVDAVTMGLMASSLKDILEEEQPEN